MVGQLSAGVCPHILCHPVLTAKVVRDILLCLGFYVGSRLLSPASHRAQDDWLEWNAPHIGGHKTCLKPDYAFKEVLCLVWASVSILAKKKNRAVDPKQS